jgi:hypothetical protein
MTKDYPARLPAVIPAGQVLVHNQVTPVARQQGTRGSRYWLQEPSDNLDRCLLRMGGRAGRALPRSHHSKPLKGR